MKSRYEIRKDAFERYFLIRKLYYYSSALWNFFLIVFLGISLICFVCFTGVVYFLVLNNPNDPLNIYAYLWQIYFLAECTLPIILIATANSSNRKILEMFLWSVPFSVAVDEEDLGGEKLEISDKIPLFNHHQHQQHHQKQHQQKK